VIVDKLKAYGWQLLALALTAGLLGQTLRLHATQLDAAAARTAHATALMAHAETLRSIADLTAAAALAVRAQENQWVKSQEENARETANQILAARADADDARRAGDRLQQRVAALVASARAAAAHPGTEPTVAPADDAIGVLADVLGRADTRAGILAEYADAARVAGTSCERDYDALTAATSQ